MHGNILRRLKSWMALQSFLKAFQRPHNIIIHYSYYCIMCICSVWLSSCWSLLLPAPMTYVVITRNHFARYFRGSYCAVVVLGICGKVWHVTPFSAKNSTFVSDVAYRLLFLIGISKLSYFVKQYS